MRNLNYTKNFLNNYKRRFSQKIKIRNQIDARIKLFLNDPTNALLKDHKLTGVRKHLRSFSASGDIRVLYYVAGDNVYLLDVGTHNQVY